MHRVGMVVFTELACFGYTELLLDCNYPLFSQILVKVRDYANHSGFWTTQAQKMKPMGLIVSKRDV